MLSKISFHIHFNLILTLADVELFMFLTFCCIYDMSCIARPAMFDFHFSVILATKKFVNGRDNLQLPWLHG